MALSPYPGCQRTPSSALRITAAWRIKKMLSKIALAAALSVATFGVALGSNENDGGNETGGYRELGPGGVVTNGVNPAYHRSLRAHVSKARTHAGSAYGFA